MAASKLASAAWWWPRRVCATPWLKYATAFCGCTRIDRASKSQAQCLLVEAARLAPTALLMKRQALRYRRVCLMQDVLRHAAADTRACSSRRGLEFSVEKTGLGAHSGGKVPSLGWASHAPCGTLA